MPEKPHNFWQELKRRKVVRVMIGYAAAAYILLELTSIIAEPLGLPDWTINFVLILLCIGFVITTVVSWIYDFTPKGIEKTKPAKVAKQEDIVPIPAKRKIRLSDIIITILLVAVIVLLYPRIFRHQRQEYKDEKNRISIAVMPFRNMTNDTIWDVWQDGIKDNLITYLSNFSEDFSVRQSDAIDGLLQNSELANSASLTPAVASNISRKLDANTYIYGSINQAGSTIRVNAQLIESRSMDSYKSFQLEGKSEKEIFLIIDSLSVMIKDFLMISIMEKQIIPDFRWLISTSSADAYRFYMYGNRAFYKYQMPSAIDWYIRAVELDTNFTEALRMLAFTYNWLGMIDQSKKIRLKLYNNKEHMSIQERIWTDVLYADYFETPYEKIKYLNLLIEIDDQMPVPYSMMANAYDDLKKYEDAIPLREKELEIYNNWGSKPRWSLSYTYLGKSYHITGQFNKERELYNRAEQHFPNDSRILYRQAILELSEGDTIRAGDYIQKYRSTFMINNKSRPEFTYNLARIHEEAGLLREAEKYYRQALSLEPESALRLNDLAWFLIEEDINIIEGLKLVDKALEIAPDNYLYVDTKGWGLYKQGKYEEALEDLEKSWELKPVYDHEVYLHLEAAKKAVADLKSEQ